MFFRILPNHLEKQLCFSTAAAAAPPSASHPRRRGETALHAAAWNGEAAVVEQLISAGAKVDTARKDGRGLGRVSSCFGSGSDEVMVGAKGFAHGQVTFVLCFGMLGHTCC